MPIETTLYSLSERAPAPDDRREGERHLTLFRVGTMVIDDRRELCLIRNLSAGGAMLRLYSENIKLGQRMTVELKCGQPLSGKVAWVRTPNLGLIFDAPVDVVAMLSQSEDGPRPRMPRIETSSFCTIREGASMIRARACDISQGGIKIETDALFGRNAEVVVSLPGLPPQPGVVRWTVDGCVGITFNRLLPLPQLIDWLKSRNGARNAA
ncbi:PilZ domain-containing protein [Sphingomonas glaciei]|uniref:PilZ domain-containing protein n=1 Tax=Sphingomonas glaciei TaxID=2938948 RepID=A0ABY5MVN0_9SPHN|nr:PilZ domain-containing protein [Sphingomonas glaciei]UUR08039.1 PilZ domain-containing protein [Sphingomonas glaciei]